jgi:hypothetical protein
MAEEQQGGEARDGTHDGTHDGTPDGSHEEMRKQASVDARAKVDGSVSDDVRGDVSPIGLANTESPAKGSVADAPAAERHPGVKQDAAATTGHAALEKTCTAPKAESNTSRAKAAKNSSAIDFSVPTLKHFATYTRVTSLLEGYIVAAMSENRRLDHILIHGLAGSGTTTLARALIRDYAPSRFEELDALTGVSLQKLKRALARANRRGVVLIRHVELLDGISMSYLAAYMSGKPMDADSQSGPGTSRAPWESDFDREIAASARAQTPDQSSRERLKPGGTVIATALMPSQLHYSLRSRFEQLVGLRKDPKALRIALSRVLRPHDVSIAPEAFPRAERLLGSLTESTEQLARAILARAQMESVQVIDDGLMKSIIEEDLADRFPITHYAASLREHLGGRKVKEATCEEVRRIADETSWGTSATHSAITTMIREDRAVQRSERPQSPI